MSWREDGPPANAGGSAITVYETGDVRRGDVGVVVPLYDHERFIVATLDSVLAQDPAELQLVIVDDGGPGPACATALEWLERHGSGFAGARLLQHRRNLGGAAARNTAVNCTASEFVFMLDSDNILLPSCVSRCLAALRDSDAAFAYPMLEIFGEEVGVMNLGLWEPERLAHGNYIDTLALIRRQAWLSVGGATSMSVPGWNDYELWCKFVEHGYWGVQVPQILARYRVHRGSNLRAITNRPENLSRLIAEMKRLHPWLKLSAPEAAATNAE
ncbi:MAG TPA: glycosyltransferase family A protein [Dehalococcoidia bacterium]|nr:glycosyltransferase family A protein [Dehalococcoidia bacterium]